MRYKETRGRIPTLFPFWFPKIPMTVIIKAKSFICIGSIQEVKCPRDGKNSAQTDKYLAGA
jgi:hypothetical protein